MSRTRGSIAGLPAACRDAVRRAIERDRRQGSGDTQDLVLVVARAVWRAGIAHGRALGQASTGRKLRRERDAWKAYAKAVAYQAAVEGGADQHGLDEAREATDAAEQALRDLGIDPWWPLDDP